jgi:hypothetical protein
MLDMCEELFKDFRLDAEEIALLRKNDMMMMGSLQKPEQVPFSLQKRSKGVSKWL